ncbi:aspartate/glutamate racemase family protein, partial [bacterium]|nr:aspartate/glutamate racemase family protein [bacterium]
DAGVDTLILGCTHYPLLKAEISEYMGPAAVLVDSAEALAAAAEGTLADLGLRRRDGDPAAGAGKNPPEGALSFYLSDIPWKFAEIGARFLGKPINNVETVGLDAMEEAGRLVLKG